MRWLSGRREGKVGGQTKVAARAKAQAELYRRGSAYELHNKLSPLWKQRMQFKEFITNNGMMSSFAY